MLHPEMLFWDMPKHYREGGDSVVKRQHAVGEGREPHQRSIRNLVKSICCCEDVFVRVSWWLLGPVPLEELGLGWIFIFRNLVRARINRTKSYESTLHRAPISGSLPPIGLPKKISDDASHSNHDMPHIPPLINIARQVGIDLT
ncbi:predicted protein [Chaetomium globosum CBS 148.51]|uniref:Uncharacterized protein n=1 Tax=Chaetomium globosum (strain ATCC 6205 / CBS 148.51 / DSM 1962 / NBRC 6347 / NRRL 1970) TaxID=306901 RepID=Q2H961_CHAGB|nr:uncharacterized protein CHGG_03243 [Chaetomium globosum CBS 148.51]EAQ91308.1 predicted protein [Chaetomium globosum CBS 148.51]